MVAAYDLAAHKILLLAQNLYCCCMESLGYSFTKVVEFQDEWEAWTTASQKWWSDKILWN